ncbi:MAG: cytochrome P450, partial [Solirubrobacterales bacterium]|nr:cytochrome P450 [Solirubrobacterales bacterium]
MSGVTEIGEPGPRPAFPGPLAVASDVSQERQARRRAPFPAGANRVSTRTTWRFRRDPLNFLLEARERWGPVFGVRILFGLNVFMIGPEANHFMLVSGRENFAWRYGRMGDLLTLIGDGLLTTDGAYHDNSRAIMMPAFHRERVALAARAMSEEAGNAADALRPGRTADVYHWTRDLAMRIAMRALFGFDPDSGHAHEIATAFESGLSFHGREFPMQLLVGPGSPHSKLKRDRAMLENLVGEEIRARRDHGKEGEDMLGSLLAATGEDGLSLSDAQVLDHVLTLLFAGHDTTTSTVSFLIYELARHPEWTARLAAERDAVCGDREPSPSELFGELPLLTRAIDETLRLYPPAWIGPRRSVRDFEFAGVPVAAGLPVAYSSWVSHRLPDVFENPHEFDPSRFEPEKRATWPRGAYVPFGMGPRVCIGKRFGYSEVHAIAAALL